MRAIFEEMEEFLLQVLHRWTLEDGRPRFVGHGARPVVHAPHEPDGALTLFGDQELCR